jgi:hypothetical protein
MRKFLAATAVAIVFVHQPAAAETVPAEGYIYSRTVLPELTEGCVAHAPGGVFVGSGPAHASFPPSGATRQVLFVSDTGASRVVATGFNTLSDCVYDWDADVLYVLDSGLEFTGATTGDTVFAFDASATNEPAAGNEVLPAGTIPNAYSVDLFPTGLLVSDAAGGGAGSVIEIDMTGVTPVASTFATGFDYTGGLLVEETAVFVVEAVEPSFESSLHRYSTAGVFEATYSGPTYEHGSNDLARGLDGELIVTGGNTITGFTGGAAVFPLVTGLDGGTGFPAFGGSVSVHPVSGRIDFLASSFSGADDDKSLHRLVPIERLVTRGRYPTADCALQLYGVELVAAAEGRRPRAAICVDGAPCDSDGEVDGACTYPLGLCFNVDDSSSPECETAGIATISLRESPSGAGAADLLADATAALPIVGQQCVFGDGVRIPLRGEPGAYRRGKGRVQVRVTTTDAPSIKDNDVVRLVCEPAP